MEIAVRTKKFANATVVRIQDVVEIANGQWCMILVHESRNHNEVTETELGLEMAHRRGGP